MTKTKCVCERCGDEIPKEWDNEHHYGTCPSCKRGSNFVLQNEELQQIADEENDRQKKNYLMNKYNVLDKNDKSGVVHVNCIGLAKMIYTECGMSFKTLEDESTGKQEIFYYKYGYYHPGGENRIREMVDDYLDDYSSIRRKNEDEDYIKYKNSVKRESLEPPTYLINVANGIYNMKKDVLEKHSPDFFFLNQIPVEYHEDAECPRIKKFVNEVVYKEYVDVVQEIAGYLMYRHYKYHKAFLFYGGGRNGKSTLLRLLRNFIGEKNVSDDSLTNLLENRFSTANIYGKLANMGGEISGKALNDTSQFKHLCGDDNIRAEKKFSGSFTFRNYAKLIFNSNHIPYSKFDKSLAYFQRWIIIVFPETFSPEDKRTDPDIEEKITTKKELEGFLLWSLAGLRRLLKNDRFSYKDDEDEETVGERYELLAKPEMRFIKDFLMVSEGNDLISDGVYDKYLDWADNRNYPKQAKKVFSRAVKKYMHDKENKIQCEIKSTRRDGKGVRVYTNICWKDQPTNSLKLESFEDDDEESSEQKKISGNIPTDIHDALEMIRDNLDAGYSIDDDWLNNNFDSGFVSKLLESGMLIRLPNGKYDINV